MLLRTLAIICGCLFVVEAARSSWQRVDDDAEVKNMLKEILFGERQPCDMQFGGYVYKTYQRELQREGNKYYVKVDIKRPQGVTKDKEIEVFKPKGKGKATITKFAC